MPDVIDLENTTKVCPFDGSNLKKIIYFSRKESLGTDENGEPLKNPYVCMSCGYEAHFYSQLMLDELQKQADESAPRKAEILADRERLKESRKPQHDKIRKPSV